jgi:hypothetical protein
MSHFDWPTRPKKNQTNKETKLKLLSRGKSLYLFLAKPFLLNKTYIFLAKLLPFGKTFLFG